MLKPAARFVTPRIVGMVYLLTVERERGELALHCVARSAYLTGQDELVPALVGRQRSARENWLRGVPASCAAMHAGLTAQVRQVRVHADDLARR